MHPLAEAIRNRLQGGVGGTNDPRGMVGIMGRGNNMYPGGNTSSRSQGLGRPAAGTNRSLASGNNPGQRLGQQNRSARPIPRNGQRTSALPERRPIPAVTSSNPFKEAMTRRLQSRRSQGGNTNA